jgi:hypothetical protein
MFNAFPILTFSVCTDWRRTHRCRCFIISRRVTSPRHPFPIVWYEYGINACIARYKALGDAPPAAFFPPSATIFFLILCVSVSHVISASYWKRILRALTFKLSAEGILMFASVCTAIYYFIGIFAPQCLLSQRRLDLCWSKFTQCHHVYLTYLYNAAWVCHTLSHGDIELQNYANQFMGVT